MSDTHHLCPCCRKPVASTGTYHNIRQHLTKTHDDCPASGQPYYITIYDPDTDTHEHQPKATT